tara:strand:- start:2210 stop:3148 length:939 start_codon:yes stop_codon:yes gene_type:complete
MNRSKLIGATALASVMAASAAHAEMSISGLFAGKLTDTDGGGLAHGVSTNSIYVSYSDSMDNGMGVGLVMSVTEGAIKTDLNIDTGMGTVALGNGVDSAVDGKDGSPACFSLNLCGSAMNTNYVDGDSLSGNSVGYKNSVGNISFNITRGMEADSVAAVAADATTDPITVGSEATEGNEAVTSVAASTSIMGATVKAGVTQIDYKGDTPDIDPSFVTVGYSIAGLNLGYALYDGDNGGEETQMGVGTSMMGMDVGITFATADLTTDVDYTMISASKGMGAASFGLDYTETDSAAAAGAGDSDAWQFTYIVGF